RVRHADRGGLPYVGMLEDGVLDLDRADRPAGRDDHVVGAAAVPEVAVLVDAAQVLGRQPVAAAPELELAGHAGRAGLAFGVLHLHAHAWDGLAERAALDREIRGARVVDEAHADLGGAVHAAHRLAEGRLDELGGLAVDRL